MHQRRRMDCRTGVAGRAGALLLSLAPGALAQNLVPNPSFEDYTSCPSTGDVDLAAPWFQPTPATSDYYAPCAPPFSGYDVPNTQFGVQSAHTGESFVGVITHDWPNLDYREYVEVPLTAALVAGTEYDVTFWVALGSASSYAADGMGALFSVGPVTSTVMGTLNYTPQVANTTGNVLDDPSVWIPISGTFEALGGEDHLTIGNFWDGANTQSIYIGDLGPGKHASYFVDSVSVTAVTCTAAPPDLVGWWRFDEGAGTLAADFAGGHDGFQSGAPLPSHVQGAVEDALSFHGFGAGFVVVPDHPDLGFGPGQDFSIDAWVRLDAPPLEQGAQALVDKSHVLVGGGALGYDFWLQGDQLVLFLGTGAGSTFAVADAPYPNDTDWHLVAVTVDRDEPDGVRFYLDGEPFGTPQDPTGAPGDLTTDLPLGLGGDVDPLGLPTLQGTLDEVEIFRRALEPEEVAALFDAGDLGKCRVDCNGNGILDQADIASGTSEDDDLDGVPDECGGLIPVLNSGAAAGGGIARPVPGKGL